MALRISIIKNGIETFLKIPNGLEMTMTDYSSVWDWDSAMKGGYSMQISIPMEGNEMVFDFAHLPAIVGKTYDWRSRVYDDGILEYEGVLTVKESLLGIDATEIDADFIASALAADLIDKTLRQVMKQTIDMGESVVGYMNGSINLTWPDYPVTFYPIHAPKFYAENWPDWCGFCNHFVDGSFQIDNAITGDFPPINETWRYNCVPQIFVLQALKSIFSMFGYRMIGSALKNLDLQRLTIFNIRALDNIGGYKGTAVKTVKQSFTDEPDWINWEDKRDETFPPGYEMTVPSTYPFNNVLSGGLFTGSGILSSKLVLNIGKIEGDLQIYGYESSSGTTTLISTHTIFSNSQFVTVYANAESIKVAATGGVLEILPGSYHSLGVLNGTANFVRSTFIDGEIVPDIAVSEFILAVKQMGVEFIPDDRDRTVELRMIAETFNSGTVLKPEILMNKKKLSLKIEQQGMVNFSNQDADTKGFEYAGNDPSKSTLSASGLVYGMYKYVASENNYYVYKDLDEGVPVDPGFELLGSASSRISVGNAGDAFDWIIKAALPLMTTVSNVEQMILCPYWDGEGNSNFGGLKNEEWPLMFTIYQSSQTHESYAIPSGGISAFGYNGNYLTDAVHLVIDGFATGWFKRYLLPWLKILSYQESIQLWMMRSNDLNSFSLRKSILMDDNLKYRVKEVKRLIGREEPMEVLAVRITQDAIASEEATPPEPEIIPSIFIFDAGETFEASTYGGQTVSFQMYLFGGGVTVDWGNGDETEYFADGFNDFAVKGYHTDDSYTVTITPDNLEMIFDIVLGSIGTLLTTSRNCISVEQLGSCVSSFSAWQNIIEHIGTIEDTGSSFFLMEYNRLSVAEINALLVQLQTHTVGTLVVKNQLPPAPPSGDGLDAWYVMSDAGWVLMTDS